MDKIMCAETAIMYNIAFVVVVVMDHGSNLLVDRPRSPGFSLNPKDFVTPLLLHAERRDLDRNRAR